MSATEISHVGQPLSLPCGAKLPNRLIKAAMAEHLAGKGLPNAGMTALYAEWGKGGWGAVMTGNVMVDPAYLGDPHDTTFPPTPSAHAAWSQLAQAIKSRSSLALMQINHPGRQSPVGAGSRSPLARTLAPSAVPLDLGADRLTRALVGLIFGTPAAMTAAQIHSTVAAFVGVATRAHGAGFDGVEIHAAHGYLLSTFLSPRTNTRDDAWGGSPARRCAIVVEIVRAVRGACPRGFVVGVKLNSADRQDEGGMGDVLEQVAVLAAEGVDFVEVSGGSYENPKMVNGNEAAGGGDKTPAREAYFLDFAKAVRERNPGLVLMLTGGFRSLAGMDAALKDGACDLIGAARPAAMKADFPKTVAGLGEDGKKGEVEAMYLEKIREPWWVRWLPSPRMQRALKGGAETNHYVKQMQSLVR